MANDVEKARLILPLHRLMEQHGDHVAAPGSMAKGAITCPFCQQKSASLKEMRGRQWFKCFRPDCPSATSGPKGAWDEVDYLAHKGNLSRREACAAYLKAAGVWKEQQYSPSILQGQKKRKKPTLGVEEKEEGRGQKGEEDAPPQDRQQAPLRDGHEGEEEGPGDLGLAALREFQRLATLSSEHEKEIWHKRGLCKAAIKAFGFKSSTESNRAIIESLRPKYPEDDMVAHGLLKREDGVCRPEPQLCGYGRTDKKDDRGEWIWVSTHPILIPYFDQNGEIIAIRPHKGNIKGQQSRTFVARFAKGTDGVNKNYRPARCVVTEGEFKACALFWAYEGKMGVAALPGISQSKNYTVMEELTEWLHDDCAVDKLIVSFDNEEKSDPRLPGFKPDKRKRFDAEIWGRYLALVLEKSFGNAMICRLPNEWRDANGKADWDGALKQLVNPGTTSYAESDQKWATVKEVVRHEFSEKLARVVGTKEFKQTPFYSSDEERIIQGGLDRLFYERRLPHGGDKEIRLAQKMIKLAHGKLKGVQGLGIQELAEQYRETVGWYYTLKPLSDAAQGRWMKRQQEENEKSHSDRNHELIWFCEQRLKGIPTQVANFRMICFYDLIRADGKRDLIVEIITNSGERSGRVRLDAESITTPSGRAGFRKWLRNHSKGIWRAGERELEDLGIDAMHDVAYMDVHEVSAVGSDSGSGLWFMGDCAYANGDKGNTELLPDEDDVYWHKGIGYQLGTTGSGSQEFRQGLPLMHPLQVLQKTIEAPDAPPKNEEDRWGPQYCLVDTKEAKDPEEPIVGELFSELAFRLKEALGSYEAYVVIGSFLAFLGAPEFFKQERCFAGLFLHGETGGGKSTTMEWAMELYGFHGAPGIGMASRNCSAVGMQILLEQYSDLPVWLTDCARNTDEQKMDIAHDAYNRVGASKWALDGVMRKVRTMFVIDGESRPDKTSTRYRYLQVLISKANQKGNQVWWFEKNRRFFLHSSDRCCAEERSLYG